MAIEKIDRQHVLHHSIEEQLKPYVRRIDEEAYYPLAYLQELGKSGLINSRTTPDVGQLRVNEVQLIEETAKICMTTGFNLWCHLASATYLRKSGRPYLTETILPQLENGEICGGTGLSNPMKFYAGLEPLGLKAQRTEGGYLISGQLPAVSNLGPHHWFGIIAALDGETQIMAYVPYHAENLEKQARVEFLGLNGSATYSCKFHNVFIPDDWVISEHAAEFVKKIRATFILYQIPLGLGVTAASIQSMRKASQKQGGCNRYLPVQPEDIEKEWLALKEQTMQLAKSPDLDHQWKPLLQLRRDVTYLTMNAVQACMVHCGSSGYLQGSGPARRLRESYFLVNLTPTLRHLEKLLQNEPRQ